MTTGMVAIPLFTTTPHPGAAPLQQDVVANQAHIAPDHTVTKATIQVFATPDFHIDARRENIATQNHSRDS